MTHDIRTAYAVALSTSVVASVLTIVYVGSNAAGESNPITAALIGEFGLLSAMTIRTLAVVVLYWGYYLVGATTAIPRATHVFGWIGAGINGLDALGNVLVAVLLGPAVISAEHGLAVAITVAVGAAALSVGPPRDLAFPDSDGASADAARTP